MLTAERRRELLEEAERLVKRLRTRDVRRTEFSPVANVVLYSHGTWPERHKRAREIARRLPTSWVAQRGQDVPKRVRCVSEVLGEVLDRFKKEEEARYLLGWTLRQLFVEEKQARVGGK